MSRRFFAELGVLVVLISVGFGTLASAAPIQLNIEGFSQCLSAVYPAGPVSALREFAERYEFRPGDGLLIYLAIYPGKYIPFFSESLQKPGLKRWSGNWETKEEALAERLRSLAEQGPVFPQDLFQSAVSECRGDLFCSALTAQNVLRTMGRHSQAIYHDWRGGKEEDRNPAWFRGKQGQWLQNLPRIQGALISLLSNGKGDRWGEWYHFFGLLTFGIHEAAVGKNPAAFDFAASLNRVLNPLFVGEKEEPGKAQLDMDSAAVVRDYLRWTRNGAALNCRSRAAYVHLAGS